MTRLVAAASVAALVSLSVQAAGPAPAWYTRHRVHIHTRLALCGTFVRTKGARYGACVGQDHLALAEQGDPAAPGYPNVEYANGTALPAVARQAYWTAAGDVAAAGGASVLVRGMKFCDEGPWWPSAAANGSVPLHPDVAKYAKAGDLANDVLGASQAKNVSTIAYYRHVDDIWVEKSRPDWVARNRDQSVAMTNHRGAWISISSGYGTEYLTTRVVELVRKGYMAIYFDETHIPSGGDFNAASQQLWKAEGRKTSLLNATEAQVAGFRQRQLARVFGGVNGAVKAANADALILVSMNSVAPDTIRQIGAVAKTEAKFLRDFGGIEAAVTLWLDVTGYPAHWWVPDADVPLYYITAIAHGGVYNRDIKEYDFADLPVAPAKNVGGKREAAKDYRALFRLSRRVSPAMTGATPVRAVRVVFNGALVNHLPMDEAHAFTVLSAGMKQPGFATFAQFREGAAAFAADRRTRALVIPSATSYAALPAETKHAVDAFLNAPHSGALPKRAVYYGAEYNASALRSMPSPARVHLPEGTATAPGFADTPSVAVYTTAATAIINVVYRGALTGATVHVSSVYLQGITDCIETRTLEAVPAAAEEGGWALTLPTMSRMAQVVCQRQGE